LFKEGKLGSVTRERYVAEKNDHEIGSDWIEGEDGGERADGL